MELTKKNKSDIAFAAKMKPGQFCFIFNLTQKQLREAIRYLNVCYDYEKLINFESQSEDEDIFVEKKFEFVKFKFYYLICCFNKQNISTIEASNKVGGEKVYANGKRVLSEEYRIGTEIFENLNVDEEFFIPNSLNEKSIMTRIRMLCIKNNNNSKFRYRVDKNLGGGHFKRIKTAWD